MLKYLLIGLVILFLLGCTAIEKPQEVKPINSCSSAVSIDENTDNYNPKGL